MTAPAHDLCEPQFLQLKSLIFQGEVKEKRMFVNYKVQNKYRLTSPLYVFMKYLVNFRDNEM